MQGDKQTGIDAGLFGTEKQRQYARRLVKAAKESDITAYVKEATDNAEQASIAGLLKWLDPGRHGNLTGEYEWYTPSAIVDAARAVMGGIDLDPASCEIANEVVQATEYFTEDDNGLEKEWRGRVFINPPFEHPTVRHFADKLMESFGDGSIKQAVWLSNACVDVGWWQDLASQGIVCFHRGRIKFYAPDKERKLQAPTMGQTIIYLGENQDEFRKRFIEFGVVLS